MRSASPLVLLALSVGGCAFVTEGEVDSVTSSIDSDGDGVVDVEDCVSDDASIFPRGQDFIDGSPNCRVETETGAEVADGIDNDCSCSDDVDGDDDDYPAVAEPVYRELASAVQGRTPETVPWPAGMRSQPDCDDSDPDVNPGAQEIPYDGVDQDCGCADPARVDRDCNDFDEDGDGQIASHVDRDLALAFFAAHPELTIDVNDPNLFKDCDDNDPAVKFGAPDDVPYDGVDTDCAGDNDYDADGDGWFSEEHVAAFQVFVSTYHPEDAPSGPDGWGPGGTGPALVGDCLDSVPANWLTGVDPGTIYPGAPDTLADGLDSDCAGDNDYDGDGDGVVGGTYTQEQLDAYRASWSGFNPENPDSFYFPDTISDLDVVLGDCDDTDPTVFPGQVESLFVDVDADCDGGTSTTPFGFGGFPWERPRQPRAAVTDGVFVFGTTALFSAKPLANGSYGDRPQAAMTFRFDNRMARTDGPFAELRWDNEVSTSAPRIHGDSFDLVADGPDFWTVSSWVSQNVPPTNQYVVVKHVYDPVTSAFTPIRATSYDGALSTVDGRDTDLDLMFVGTGASRRLWVLSCGGAGRELDDLGDVFYQDDNDPPQTVATPVLNGGLRAAVLVPDQLTSTFTTTWLASHGSLDIAGHLADSCFQWVDPTTQVARYVTCDNGGCVSYDGVAGASTASPIQSGTETPYTGSFREVDQDEGLITMVRGTSGFQVVDRTGPTEATYSFLDAEVVLSADGVWADVTGDDVADVFFVAAVVQTPGLDEVRIGWTADPAGTPPTWVTLDPDDDDTVFSHCAGSTAPPACDLETGRHLEPERVELVATKHRLGVVFTAHSLDATLVAPAGYPQDAVGWAFFSYYTDGDGDGYPADPGGGVSLDPSFVDPDDTDPAIVP